MKMLNAHTLELDDAGTAVAELLTQLELDNNLCKNSAGFITCSYDFIEAGIVAAVCKALPFEVVGCTSLANASNGVAGGMLLCLSVLTGDDCEFAVAKSAPLLGDLQRPIANMWHQAVEKLPAAPALALTFAPMIRSVGGELILNALDEVARPTPIFGLIACDHDTSEYNESFTIFNGDESRESMSVLLISGNVHPRFVVTSTSDDNLQKQRAIITSSEGSMLNAVNGMSARDYLRSLGLMPDGSLGGISSVPFVVDYKDGTQPVARAIYMLNDDGSAICGGAMPKGGTLSIGRMDVDDIMLTAEQSLNKLLADGSTRGIITFPCLGRNMVLGTEPLAEAEKVDAVIADAVPWHLAYSGGELCPVYHQNGDLVNRFHNFTFIACAF